MRKSTVIMAATVLAASMAATSAHAEGLGVEANYARANGHWGAELGAGYSLDVGGFSLTPGGGVHIRDGDTKLYGRLEATYSLPASLTIGAGVRISGDDPRPYATVALPLLPKVQIKGNVGPKYGAVGLRVGY